MTTTTTTETELLAIAESMLATYKLAAYSERREISQGNTPMYRTLKATLIFTLTQLTGNRARAFMVYSLWLDCGEPIEYCVSLATEANWRRAAFTRVSWESHI